LAIGGTIDPANEFTVVALTNTTFEGMIGRFTVDSSRRLERIRGERAAEGLPLVFNEFTYLGGFASIDALSNGEKWIPAASNRRVARERPGPNAVLRLH
jgi:hypothetical protein